MNYLETERGGENGGRILTCIETVWTSKRRWETVFEYHRIDDLSF